MQSVTIGLFTVVCFFYSKFECLHSAFFFTLNFEYALCFNHLIYSFFFSIIFNNYIFNHYTEL